MRVSFFVTCLVDQLWTSVGVSSVEVLRRVGCEVEFDKRQTCCAQPAYNTGYLDEARQVAQRFISIFEESNAEAIVSPSGSCTAMVHHYPELFAGDPEWLQRAQGSCGKDARTEFVPDSCAQGRRRRRVVERKINLARCMSRFARSQYQERAANSDSKRSWRGVCRTRTR